MLILYQAGGKILFSLRHRQHQEVMLLFHVYYSGSRVILAVLAVAAFVMVPITCR